jgi:hypothetical protein
MAEPHVRDVVLFENGGNPFDPRMAEHPPIRNRITIGDGIYIERLPEDLNRKIKSASAFRGHHWHLDMGALPTFYAFVRDIENPDERWDESMALQIAVGLSRLCHPTSIGLEYAVRVYAPGLRHTDDYQIEPSLIAGHGNQAFIPDPNGRNWLTPSNVTALSRLQAALPGAPDRIGRAAWFFEYAARTEHVPIRLTLTAAGIEALVHVERIQSTRQFVVGANGAREGLRHRLHRGASYGRVRPAVPIRPRCIRSCCCRAGLDRTRGRASPCAFAGHAGHAVWPDL